MLSAATLLKTEVTVYYDGIPRVQGPALEAALRSCSRVGVTQRGGPNLVFGVTH